MFPKLSQRVMIVIGAVVAGLVYMQGAEVARAADGSDGCTLLFAASPVAAIGTFVMYSVLALGLGVLAAAMGNRLAGVYVVAVALLFPAIKGGGIDQWLRNAESSHAYWRLAADAVTWGALVAGLYLLIEKVTPYVARVMNRGKGDRVDELLSTERMDLHVFTVRHVPLIGGLVLVSVAIRHAVQRSTQLSDATVRVLLSCLTATALGTLFSGMFLQSPDPFQVTWGLAIAFVLATVIASIMFPTDRPIGMLISPVAASVVACSLIALSGASHTQLLSAYFTGDLANMGVALPIYYASAGVAGATLGVGWARLLISSFGPIDGEETSIQ